MFARKRSLEKPDHHDEGDGAAKVTSISRGSCLLPAGVQFRPKVKTVENLHKYHKPSETNFCSSYKFLLNGGSSFLLQFQYARQYRVGQKKLHHRLLTIILSNLNRFKKNH